MNESDVAQRVVRLLDTLADDQQRKVLGVARALRPRLTEDDLKNPDDYPVLHADPRFNYEDGVLAGTRMCAAAVRALIADSRARGPAGG